MLSTVLMSRGGFLGADAIGQSLRESEQRYAEQNRTSLSIESTSIDAIGANITFTVRNDGKTTIADFASMDVLVQYFGELGARYDKWIPYTSGALGSDTWTDGTFTDDFFEPGMLNPGESMEVLIRVNPVVGAGTTNLAIIGAKNGVTTRTHFEGPP